MSNSLTGQDQSSQPEFRDLSGIQSVDAAIAVMRTLAASRGPLSLKKLSELCRMDPSKLHRYLHSLTKTGMVVQRRTGEYDLGRLSLQIGLAAVQRHDLVNHAADHLQQLALETDSPVCLSVFSLTGPTIIRWHRGNAPIVPLFALGQTLPLVTSATGQVFLAFLPRHETQALIEAEKTRERTTGLYETDAIDRLVGEVREQGYAVCSGGVLPDQTGISAPLINWQNEASAAVTIVTRLSAHADALERSKQHLQAFCSRNSLQSLEHRVREP